LAKIGPNTWDLTPLKASEDYMISYSTNNGKKQLFFNFCTPSAYQECVNKTQTMATLI